ncbi:MAG: ornithine carbamoyltransferase [Acidobacteria bacterium]|nr:ornithine carbamoyltransferase [Acidobacteriota bacterium]
MLDALFLGRWRLRPAPGHTKRDLLSLHNLTIAEFSALLDLAEEMKQHPESFQGLLTGRTLALIFEKPSLRTRVTFEVGMVQLGGHPIYLAPADIALGKREVVKDVARNLARWVNTVAVRTFSQHILEEMAGETNIPIINALSDLLHPLQALADVLTLREVKGRLRGLRLAYVGDGNNVANALAQAAAKTGMHLSIATPRGYEPAASVFMQARVDALPNGAQISVVQEPADAVSGADAVYTDVWTSMGQEHEARDRKKFFANYQVDSALMSLAKPDAVFMHCLPAHRGDEVTDDVLDGPRSVVLEQAENRLHVAKAVLLALLGEPRV